MLEMKVKYKINIGYPQAVRKGNIIVDEEEIEGMTEDEKEAYISEMVWEDASQYVDTSWEIEEE
jgi:hypothetical protein